MINQSNKILNTNITKLVNQTYQYGFSTRIDKEIIEKGLNIEIIRPSINRSFAEFKATNGKLFYGLGAIKSVGFEAISNIVKEREKNGSYKTFVDFINRVDSKNVNKLQLEGLVKAGVFDEFDNDRSKILNSIPKIIQQIKNMCLHLL